MFSQVHLDKCLLVYIEKYGVFDAWLAELSRLHAVSYYCNYMYGTSTYYLSLVVDDSIGGIKAPFTSEGVGYGLFLHEFLALALVHVQLEYKGLITHLYHLYLDVLAFFLQRAAQRTVALL